MEQTRTILTVLFHLLIITTYGQLEQTEKIQLKLVNPQDSVAKYAYLSEDLNSTDAMKAHESIWRLESVREVAVGLNAIASDMETFTIILDRPTDNTPYYIIGLYQRQTQVLNKLMIYRVHGKLWTIEKKQDWETKWTRVRE